MAKELTGDAANAHSVRLLGAAAATLGVLLLLGWPLSHAAGQPQPRDAPPRFGAELARDLFPPYPANVVAVHQPAARTALEALRQGCIAAVTEPPGPTREAAETRAAAGLRGLQRRWLGFLQRKSHTAEGSDGMISLSPNLWLRVGALGWAMPDPYNIAIATGSNVDRAMRNIPQGSPVMVDVEAFAVHANERGCRVTARLRGIAEVR
jgi:hypothetical protein